MEVKVTNGVSVDGEDRFPRHSTVFLIHKQILFSATGTFSPKKLIHAGPPLMLLAAVHESGFGTKLECRDVRYHDPTLGDKQAHW